MSLSSSIFKWSTGSQRNMPCTVIRVITKDLENRDAKCCLNIKCKECCYEVLSLNDLVVHIEICHVIMWSCDHQLSWKPRWKNCSDLKCKECRYEVLSLNSLVVHIETCHVIMW